MKKNTLVLFTVIVILIILAGLSVLCAGAIKGKKAQGPVEAAKSVYYCAMHPNFISDKPGNCLICGMTLVKKEASAKTPPAGRKIVFYRNPMNPEMTSPVPMKDEMGMDYVAVYETETTGKEAGIYMSPEKQQLIGIKKEKIQKRRLAHEIRTVGKIAYDPELYIAQQEYLEALKAKNATSDSSLSLVKQQMQSFLEAAEQRLLLLGMSKGQIQGLAAEGKPQQNLYLPVNAETVWVYMTIYEYEIGMIKEGLPVQVEAVAFPGEIFTGEIVAITPVLDSMTRSINVRAEVKNTGQKLKPQMFVNAVINVDLGEKLAVPESAVMDTGIRQIVYLAKAGDMLEMREVTLGQKAQGYYEALGGLKEGDVVVTSGNFLVDSESKLKSAFEAPEHQHGN